MKDSNIKYYSVILGVDIDELKATYLANLPETENISTEGMIEGELKWLYEKGISVESDLQEISKGEFQD